MAPLTIAVPTAQQRRREAVLSRFRTAVTAVMRHLGGARALAGAAEEATNSADVAAFLRRAASFGVEDPGCDSAAAATHPHRPAFHLMPRCGWVNDPNGPIFYGGRYHMFFQHQPDRAHWDWGLVWGHAVSNDLVTWAHLPPAIEPTPGTHDALACFSGCCFATDDGGVTMLYTGVRPRRRTTSTGLVCALMSPRELPCECFQPPPALLACAPGAAPAAAAAAAAAASRPGSRPVSAPGSPLAGCPAACRDVPWCDGGAGTGLDTTSSSTSGAPSTAPAPSDGLIGCAAELYAAVASATAESALAHPGSQPSSPLAGGAHPYGAFPSVMSPGSPMPLGVGGAHSVAATPSAAAAAAAAVEEAGEWLEGLASQPFVEAVCAARAAANDDEIAEDAVPAPDLRAWRKLAAPVLEAPPAELLSDLIGWRDPFVFADLALPPPGGGPPARVWRMLLGVGLKSRGGAALIYTSRAADGASGWAYSGVLCAAADMACKAAAGGVGAMWECPLLVPLSPAAPSGAVSHAMFCVSPDRPTNRVLYWVGRYASGRFSLHKASGPHALDLGDVAYAPNVLRDGAGRALLFAWLQERDAARVRAHAHARPPRPPPEAGVRTQFGGVAYASVADAAAALDVAAAEGYSGCLSAPRVLSLSADGRRVAQAPAAELATLRRGAMGTLRRGTVLSDALTSPDDGEDGDAAVELCEAATRADVLCRFARGTAAAVGLWRAAAPEAAAAGALGLLLSFWFEEGTLHAAHEPSLEAAMAAAAAAHASPAGVGGSDDDDDMPDDDAGASAGTAAAASGLSWLDLGGDDDVAVGPSVELRVLYDHSAVEAFTTERGAAPGLALATRHYGGPTGDCGALRLVALGGDAAVLSATAWAMASIWEAPEEQRREI